MLLIREKAHELQQAEKKVTIFLAPRVSLVNQVFHCTKCRLTSIRTASTCYDSCKFRGHCVALQQADVLRKHLDLRVAMYYGEMKVDCWSKLEWLKQWDGHDVMIMTPQILLDILRHGYITVIRV